MKSERCIKSIVTVFDFRVWWREPRYRFIASFSFILFSFFNAKAHQYDSVGLAGDNPFGLLQGVILLETKQNYETPLVVSCLSADPFRDNGFIAILSTLPDYTAVHFRRPDMP
jgi:hypothetical protein